MELEMCFRHAIKERNLEELKSYFQPKVFIEYCKECKYYSKIWTCPPFSFDVEQLQKGYEYTYIIGSKLYTNELKDHFREQLHRKGTEYVTSEIYKAGRFLLDKKLNKIADWQKQIRVLYAGRCLVCNPCRRENQLSCMQPQNMQFSLESIGFDVASICKDILEDQLLWAKENLPEYFLFVSAVFSKERLDIKDIYNTIA